MLVYFFFFLFGTSRAETVSPVPGEPGEFAVHPDTTVRLVYQDTLKVQSFSDFMLPVLLQKGGAISAISLGFIFPADYVEIKDMRLANGIPGYSYNVTDSLFKMAWSNVIPISMDHGDTILDLYMRSKDLGDLTGAIRLELDVTSEFADDSAHIIEDVVLLVPEIWYPVPDPDDSLTSGYLKVYPNPFKEIALIEFYLESESRVTITLCNLLGENMRQVADRICPKGFSRIYLPALEFSKGVYLLKFETNDGTKSTARFRKIIVLR